MYIDGRGSVDVTSLLHAVGLCVCGGPGANPSHGYQRTTEVLGESKVIVLNPHFIQWSKIYTHIHICIPPHIYAIYALYIYDIGSVSLDNPD